MFLWAGCSVSLRLPGGSRWISTCSRASWTGILPAVRSRSVDLNGLLWTNETEWVWTESVPVWGEAKSYFEWRYMRETQQRWIEKHNIRESDNCTEHWYVRDTWRQQTGIGICGCFCGQDAPSLCSSLVAHGGFIPAVARAGQGFCRPFGPALWIWIDCCGLIRLNESRPSLFRTEELQIHKSESESVDVPVDVRVLLAATLHTLDVRYP